jgi:hypothetical protein
MLAAQRGTHKKFPEAILPFAAMAIVWGRVGRGAEVCGAGDTGRVACEQKRGATRDMCTRERIDES